MQLRVLILGVPLAACSLMLGEGYTSSDPAGAGEAGTQDSGGSPEQEGGTEASADPGAPDGATPGELLGNAGFEAEGAECGPSWTAYGAGTVLSRSTGMHGSACH